MNDNTEQELLECGTCVHYSQQDRCCNLTGDTRHKGDAACFDHSDGKVEEGREADRCNE